MKKLLVISTLFFICPLLRAQNEVIIATTPASPIILDNVKKIGDDAEYKDTVLPAPAFNYNIQPKRYLTTVELDTIRAAKIGSEPLQKLYRTYARAGVGNYSTFMGEFSAGSLRSKSGAWGVRVRHFSAGSGPKNVQGDFAGFSRQDVNIFGKRFLKKHTLYGGFDYDRDVVYNYGSASAMSSFTKDYTRQYFNVFSANTSLQSHYTDSAAINHRVALRYYHLGDRYDAKEDNVLFGVSAGRYVPQGHLGAAFGVDYNRNSGASDTASNSIVSFVPMFSAHGKKFQAAIGFNLSFDARDENFTYFYPRASFSYDIVNNIIVPYIMLDGYLERNSYRSLSLVNPFILSASGFSLRNTQHKYEVSAGLRGSLSADLVYDIRAMRVELVNAPFFVNTTEQQDIFRNKFDVMYDNAEVYNVHAQLGWQRYEKIRITATGDWYQYSMTNELHPWHTPTLRMSLLAEYNLRDKILARANIYYLNGQYAKIQGVNGPSVVNLKGLVDLNLGFEYRYTKFLSLFLNLNNIAGQRYQRWYAYPTQKFNFLGGLTYTF